MTIDHQLFRELGLPVQVAIYPGQPVTVAFCIIKAFPNFEAATKKGARGDETPAAVASLQIPGAGGRVYNALDLLRGLRTGVSLKTALEDADATWGRVDNHANGGGSYAKDDAGRERFIQRWKDGQAQAD